MKLAAWAGQDCLYTDRMLIPPFVLQLEHLEILILEIP